MSRPLRIEFPGAVLHVTSRGNNKQNIYLDDHDRHTFLDLLGEVVRVCDWIVTAYVLMSNHFHLVVQLTAANLSIGMKSLNGEYARHFNNRHGRVGHLMQGRFDSPLVDEERYMLTVLRYVVLNPVRAGMIASAGDYPWSSYRATVGDAPAPPWLAVDNVLALFGPNREMARHEYRQFIGAGVGNRHSPWEALKGQIYLGSDKWVENIRERLQSDLHPDEHPFAQREPQLATMSDVIAAVASGCQVDPAFVRLERGGTPRMIAAWLAWYEAHLPLRTIAAALRLRSASYVSRLVRRCEKSQTTDAILRKTVERSAQTLHGMWRKGKVQT